MGAAPHVRSPQAGSPHVWLDVTQTAQIPMRAGIPRIVRGLYRELTKRIPVFPAQWIEWPGKYYRVKPNSPEQRRLDAPDSPNAFVGFAERWTRPIRARPVADAEAFAPGAAWLVPEPFWEGRAAFWSRRLGTSTRRVALFYDATPLAAGSQASHRRRARYIAYLRALCSFNRVVCISRESRDDLLAFWREHGLPETEVCVEPLPCDFTSRPRQAFPNFDAKRILVVSTLDAHKNHACLLEACRRLWNEDLSFSLNLVGRSSGTAGRRVQAEIAALAADGRPIAWREQVDEQGLVEAYRRCSFTAYPSLKEGFGLPILESLWHGRPCVCGSNGALGEAASGGGCVAANQTNPESLAAGIRLLLTDRDAYARLCDEAANRAYRTWDDYVDALISILTEFAATP